MEIFVDKLVLNGTNLDLQNPNGVLSKQSIEDYTTEYTKKEFLSKHRHNMTMDSVFITDNIYKYKVQTLDLIISEEVPEVFIPSTFYTKTEHKASLVENVIVNAFVENITISNKYKKLTFENNTSKVLNIYFPNYTLEDINESCFYKLGHNTTFEDIVTPGVCQGIVLGKDFFNECIEDKVYKNFSNVPKIFIYNGYFSEEIDRTEKVELVQKALNTTAAIYFYTYITDLYLINNTTTTEYEYKYIIKPTSNTIDIDTISEGRIYTLDLSELSGDVTILRSLGKENFTLGGLITGNKITNILENNFSHCYSLEEVDISFAISSMFNYSYNLKTAKINMKTIPSSCFEGCYCLENINFGENLETIESTCFKSCHNLKTINLPSNLKTIDENAFQLCECIEEIIIPDGVTYIGAMAFNTCRRAKKLFIPSTITYIGADAFLNCTGLKYVECLITGNSGSYIATGGNASQLILNEEAPTSVQSSLKTMFGFSEEGYNVVKYTSSRLTLSRTYTKDIIINPDTDKTFSGTFILNGSTTTNYCRIIELNLDNGFSAMNYTSNLYALTSVSLPSKLTKINSYAFMNWYSLNSIDLPNSISLLSSFGFYNCYGLSSVALPSKLTSIEANCFSNCYKLQNLTVQNSLINLNNNAFSFCFNLSKISLPNSLKYIGNSAFYNCYALNGITVPKGVSYLGSSVFKNCFNLKNVEILSPSLDLKETVFENCFKLKNVKYLSLRGPIYENNINTTVKQLILNSYASESTKQSLKNVFKPNQVFEESIDVIYYGGVNPVLDMSVVYENSVKLLPDPDNLPSGILSKSGSGGNLDAKLLEAVIKINSLSVGLFSGFQGLVKLELSDDLQTINNNAFNSCINLTSVSVPTTVTSIGTNVFENCLNLKSAYLSGDIPNYTFNNCSSLKSFSVTGNVGIFAFACCTNLSSINFVSNISSIGQNAFKGCIFNEIELPDTITSIDTSAFESCNGLSSIKLSSTLSTLQNNAFKECVGLESITLPSTLKSLTEDDFYNNYAIKEINLQYIPNLSGRYFSSCCALSSVTFASDLSIIGNTCLIDCVSLKSISFPDSLNYIGPNTCYGCNALSALTIPSNVTYIGSNAFYNCVNLKSVVCLTEKNTGSFTTTNGKASYLKLSSKADETLQTQFKTMFGYEEPGVSELTYNTNTIDLSSTYLQDISLKPSTTLSGLFNITRGTSMQYRLINVSIADGIDELGDSILTNCYALTSVSLPSTLTKLGSSAFSGCRSLRTINLPNSLKTISNLAFSGCYNLDIVDLPPVSIIKSQAFENCYNLKRINIPDGINEIKLRAFYHCRNLKYINLPNSISVLDNDIFHGTFTLKEIILPTKLTKLGTTTFNFSYGLRSILIPNGVTKTDGYNFQNCQSLRDVILSSSLVDLGNTTFGNCCNLENVFCLFDKDVKHYHLSCSHVNNLKLNKNLPQNAKMNLVAMFNADTYTELEIIYYSGKNPVVDCSVNYTNDVVLLPDLTSPPSGTIEFSGSGGNIKDKLVMIDLVCDGDFSNFDKLEVVSTTSGKFENCTSLRNVVVYGDISANMFKNCTSINYLMLKSTKINTGAFDNCTGLKEITLLNPVTFTGTTTNVNCVIYSTDSVSAKSYFGESCKYVTI